MVFIFLISILIIALFYCFYWYWTIPNNLPPGPNSWPYLGSVLALKFSGKNDVTVLEKWSQKYGNLFSFYMGPKLIVVLSDYDTIEKALVKQGNAFSGRVNAPMLLSERFREHRNGFLMNDGEQWKEQRRFAISKLRDFGMGKSILEHHITETTEILLRDLDKIATNLEDSKNLQTYFTKASAGVICLLTFGRIFDDPEFWRQLQMTNVRVGEAGISFLSAVSYFPWMVKLPGISKRYNLYTRFLNSSVAYMDKLVESVKDDYNSEETPQNYIHAFQKAQNETSSPYYTNNELLASVLSLFTAGSDTTATTLRYGIYYMCLNPEIQEMVFQEINETIGLDRKILSMDDKSKLPYTEACIMEIQRMANLVPLSLMHRTMDNTVLDGFTIPKDQFDPNRFLTPDKKNIVKIPALIPFSAGKRLCAGEALAKMELFIFFTSLIIKYRFGFEEGEKCDANLERSIGFVSHPKNYRVKIEFRKI